MRRSSLWRRVVLVAIGALLLALVVPAATGASKALAEGNSVSPPAAPSNVTLTTPYGPLYFYIAWKSNSNQTGFQVYNGVTIENVNSATQDYYLWAAQPNQYMCVAVRAYNSSGYSAWAGVWTCGSTPAAVAQLTIYADSAAAGSSILNITGHAFITVKDISAADIDVGVFSGIAPGKEVSLGTWGDLSQHAGLWYDLEEYFAVIDGYFNTAASLTTKLSASQLSTFNALIPGLDSWSLLSNCSSFASSVWDLFSPIHLSAGLPNTPSGLESSIETHGGYTIGNQGVAYNYAVYFAQGKGTPTEETTLPPPMT
jgi:hypothetical protein